MSDLNLDVDFVLNTPEALAEAERVKKGIADVGKTAEEANRKVAESVNQVVAKNKSNFNGLQNSINQISRELPAFTYSAQTGFMAISNNIPMLIDQIGSIKKANADLVANGQKGVPVWKQLATGLFSWGTALSVGVTLLTVYGKEIGNFLIALFKGKEAINAAKESFVLLNKAIESVDFKKAIINVNELSINIELAKKGLIDKKDVLEKYNTTIGNTTGQVKTLTEAENALAKNADNYVKMTLYKAAANLALEEAAKKAVAVEQTRIRNAEDFKNSLVENRVSSGGAAGFGTGQFNENEYKKETERIKAAREKRKADAMKIDQDAMDAQLGIAKSFQEKAAKISATNKWDFGGDAMADGKTGKTATDKGQRELESALNLRKGVLEKIAKLDAEYARKGFDKDAEELQALKDKFVEMRKIIIDENEKLAKYNKTNKNKVSLIAINSVDGIEKRAVEDLTYRQQTNQYKTTLEEQKKLYSQYEAYKTTFGEAKANERFDMEVKSNKELIKELTAENLQINSKTSPLSAPQQERFAQNKKEIAELQSLEDKRYAAAYESALTTAQKIERINEEYRGKAKELAANITDEQKTNLLKLRDEAVKAAQDEALKKTEIYKNLSEDIIDITREQVIEQIAILEKLLQNGEITGAAKTEVENQLSNLKIVLKIGVDEANLTSLQNQLAGFTALLNGQGKDDAGNTIILNEDQTKQILSYIKKIKGEIADIDVNGDGNANYGDKLAKQFKYLQKGASTEDFFNGLSADLGEVSGAFGELSNSLGGVNTKAGYTLDTIGQLVGVASDAAGAASSFASGDIIGGVTKTIKAVAGIFSIGKKVKEMNAAARKEVEDFYASAISGERAYQELLTERSLNNVRDNKTVLQGIRSEIALRKTQLNSYAKESAEIMAKLQGQSSIASETYKHGTWFRKAQVNKTYSSLAGKSFAELSQLLAQGKLEASAKALVERLVELEQKGYDAEQAMADLAKETSELFTGTTADNLTNKLADMFRSGKTGAQDLADFFKETMDDAAVSIFKNKVLSDLMLKFYDEFDKAAQSDDSLTDVEVEKLRVLFLSYTDDANKKYNDLKKVTGSNLISPSANPSSLTGGIRATQTEETGNKIEGISRAQYEVQKKTFVIHTNGLELMKQQLMAAERTAAASENTVERLDSAIGVLISIKDNTAPKLIPR